MAAAASSFMIPAAKNPETTVLICGAAQGIVPRTVRRQFGEVWTINQAHKTCHIVPDLVIAMDDFRRDAEAEPGYVEKIFAGHDAPVLTTVAYPEWPRGKPYPLQDVIDGIDLPAPIVRHIFDNSVNYAFALALKCNFSAIGFHGIAFCYTDKPGDIEVFADHDWGKTVYAKTKPDWFKWYGETAMMARRPREPGIEAFHLLLGVALERGIAMRLGGTVLNIDREPFFYGYQFQPHVVWPNDDT